MLWRIILKFTPVVCSAAAPRLLCNSFSFPFHRVQNVSFYIGLASAMYKVSSQMVLQRVQGDSCVVEGSKDWFVDSIR